MSEGPIATEYIEIRPTPNAQAEFTHDVHRATEPAARGLSARMAVAVRDGLKTPAGTAGIGAGVGAALGTVVGAGITRGVGAAMRGLSGTISAASDLNETVSKTRNVFGGASEAIEKWSQGSAKAFGLSQQAALAAAAQYGDMFHQLGFSETESAGLSERLVKLAADLGSFHNVDPSDVLQRIGASFRGEYDSLQQLIPNISAARVQQEALAETHKKTASQLTAAEKATATLAIIQRDGANATNDFAETSGQLANRQRILSAEIDNTRAKIGTQLLPVMNDAAGAASVLAGFTERHTKLVEIVGGVAVGLYGATKAVKAYREVRDVLFLSSAKQVTANEAVAASYDQVAAAATRAAGAETAAGSAGGAGAGGAIARGGLLATVGGATLGIVAAGIAVAVKEILDRRGLDKTIKQQVAAAVAAGPAAQTAQAAQYGVTPGSKPGEYIFDPKTNSDRRNAGFDLLNQPAPPTPDSPRYVDPRLAGSSSALAAARMHLAAPDQRAAEASGLAGVFGSAFTPVASRSSGDIPAARAAQREADAAVRAARQAVTDARAGTAGASAGQIAGAEASVLTARDALRKRGGNSQAEQLRLEAAEARLADLRGKGGVNTDKLRAAEDKLATARANARQAADTTKKAEAGTALSVQGVLDRLGGQLKNAKGLRDDAKVLIKDGVSKGVLEELTKLEQTAPGTLDKMAKGLTPALAKQLNSQYAGLQKVQQEFLVAPLRAAVEQAKAEQDKILTESAKHQAALYAKALKDAGVELTPKGAPTPTGPGGRPEAPDTADPAPPTHGTPDPHEHGAPVTLHVTGYGARQVRQVAVAELARADRQASLVIGRQG